MKRAYLFLLLIIISAGVSLVVSGWIRSEPTTPRPCSLESIADYLSLTPEQLKQMEPLYAELGKKRAEALKEKDKAVSDLVLVLKSHDAKPNEVDNALRAVDAAQSKLRSVTIHHLVRLKTVLTEDQADKLFDLVGKRLCVADSPEAMK